jgi:ubiquinone/menaquinone biosynthesis C-methylase UbiE
MENRRDFFDFHASSWDEKLKYEEKTSELLEVTKWFELTEGDSVLDVGTGTGVLLPFISESIGLKGILLAMDFSFKMLEMAKLRNCGGGKILINASIEAIPFRSNQFDRITCFSAFPHFPNKARALLEMVRVLKSGGCLFIAHLHSIEEINQLHQQVGGPVARDFLPHPERIRSLMKESGLDEISISNEPGKFLAQGKKV